jgi:hypothetical protein
MNPEEQSVASNGKAWFLGAAVLAVASLVSAFLIVSGVQANADYICTHIVDETDPCTNGSWGGWQTLSTSNDTASCVSTQVQSRTYTGSRVVRHVIQYLNLRTACESGYTQEQIGSGGGASGNQGRGGDVITESSACQIVETQTTRTPMTTGSCAGRTTTTAPQTTITSSQTDIGSIQQATQHVAGVSDLDAFRASMIRVTIGANPQLVRSGDRSTVKWAGREVTSCTVTGTNGDGPWTGTSGEQVTAPISGQIIYTANCVGFNGTPVSATTSVGMIPVFQEQ